MNHLNIKKDTRDPNSLIQGVKNANTPDAKMAIFKRLIHVADRHILVRSDRKECTLCRWGKKKQTPSIQVGSNLRESSLAPLSALQSTSRSHYQSS